jgi:hypothetical protein
LKGILVHLNNPDPHNSRQSCKYLEGFHARRVPHPTYNPDRAPSDFFLFGHLKTKLVGLVIPGRKALISTIRQIFSEIPREKLISVCLSWKRFK